MAEEREARRPQQDEALISDEALKRAEQYIEAEEGATNRLGGFLGTFVTTVVVVMSVFHLYTAYAIVPTQQLRMIHVGFVLFLTFLLFPTLKRLRNRVCWWDWIGAAASLAVIGYGIVGGDDFTDRKDRKSTRLNSSHIQKSRMPSSA